MERGRLLFNGDLLYPKKGKQPPTPPEGYMPDTVDPWVMHRMYKSCVYRSFVNVPTPCGIKKYTYYCELDCTITNHIKCDPCTKSVEGNFQGESGLLTQRGS